MSFTTTEPPFRFRQGTRPLLISMPHVGTFVPPALAARLTDEAQGVPDTDWHLERLYDFADALGASVLNDEWVSVTSGSEDFNFKQFRSNTVLRWEYRPGSVLFFVWQQGRGHEVQLYVRRGDAQRVHVVLVGKRVNHTADELILRSGPRGVVHSLSELLEGQRGRCDRVIVARCTTDLEVRRGSESSSAGLKIELDSASVDELLKLVGAPVPRILLRAVIAVPQLVVFASEYSALAIGSLHNLASLQAVHICQSTGGNGDGLVAGADVYGDAGSRHDHNGVPVAPCLVSLKGLRHHGIVQAHAGAVGEVPVVHDALRVQDALQQGARREASGRHPVVLADRQLVPAALHA